MTTGEQIKTARLSAGMTQQAVAGMMGIDRRTIQRWESDEFKPNKWALAELMSLLDNCSG